MRCFLKALQSIHENLKRIGWMAHALEATRKGELTLPILDSSERLRFVYIPAGMYTMGVSDDDRDRLITALQNPLAGHNAMPAIRIAVTRGFFMLDHEVTRGQFETFHRTCKPGLPDLEQTVGESAPVTSDTTAKTEGDDPALPVTGVTWIAAKAFCDWVQTWSGCCVRLPTEIEWEYAARGPQPQPYPWPGEAFHAWAEKGSDGAPRSVLAADNKDLSWRSLSDMAGNVSEWCLDRYRTDLHQRLANNLATSGEYRYDPAVNRLVGYDMQMNPRDPQARTYRGGSYKDPRGLCEVTGRRSWSELESSPAIGFRPVLVLDIPAAVPVQEKKP